MAARYAVYYAPPEDSAFWRLGCRWLGRDAATGAPLTQPELPGIAVRTASPRRYGLHATLKAPIVLADGVTETTFLDAVLAWASAEHPFALPPLEVATLGDFVAIRPSTECPALVEMAARCVRDLDRFRAPPSEAERARRKPDALPERERGYLEAWGYPYVFDAYRFHVTLSDSIADARHRAEFQAAAKEWMSAADLATVRVSDACVFAQASADAPFMLTHRFRFSV